jgi:hypothetical protein
MDGRGVTMTPGTTLRFGSLGIVYTGPIESVAGRTFGRPPRPDVLTGALAHEGFVRSFSSDTIVGMLWPNPKQECFRLAAYYLTDLTFQASGDGLLGWGGVHGAVHCNVAPWTAWPPGRPGDGLR